LCQKQTIPSAFTFVPAEKESPGRVRPGRGFAHVFMTERGGPMTPKAFHALFGRIGARAKMPFPIHPHMLRHGTGYALAMPVMTRARCKHGLVIEIFNTRSGTLSLRVIGSGISGGIDEHQYDDSTRRSSRSGARRH